MQPDDLPMEERLRANARLVFSIATEKLGVAIGYDETGVRWLDGYIQRQHQSGNAADHAGLISTLGSFLGECIIHSFGGSWALVDESWGVRFDSENVVFPFAKVAKQLDRGSEDSVLSFFSIIPMIFKLKGV
jgi:hypothetical protein